MIGRIHSIETLGGADGPGIRMVVFMQGCGLRCVYCHNPETWPMEQGVETGTIEIVEKAKRYMPYFGVEGGVTLSGGEPLLQNEFAATLFEQLKSEGIGTALDTAGVKVTSGIKRVLASTDVVLLDVKMTDEQEYRKLTGGSLHTTMEFLKTSAMEGCRIWIRHVVIPGINDSVESIDSLCDILLDCRVPLDRVELLPYHRMGIDKYRKMQQPYLLELVPEMDEDKLGTLVDRVRLRLGQECVW